MILFIEFRFRENVSQQCAPLAESGRLEFDEFVTLAAKFIVEEDAEALEKELREAFRLYDKEGMANGGSYKPTCRTNDS